MVFSIFREHRFYNKEMSYCNFMFRIILMILYFIFTLKFCLWLNYECICILL